MKLEKMKKEELELLSNKDITNLLLTERGKMNTAEIFQEIIRLLELPKSTFENKIGDFYTSLTTDKRFVMLEDGFWDLRSRHTSDKVILKTEEEEEEELEDVKEEPEEEEKEALEDDYDAGDDDGDYDEQDDGLKDLVVIDEEEMEQE